MSLDRLSAALHDMAHADGNSDDAAQAIADLIDERITAADRRATPEPDGSPSSATGLPDEIDVFEHGDARELLIEQRRGHVWISAGVRPVTKYVHADIAAAYARAEATSSVILAVVRAALGARDGESTEDAAKRVTEGVRAATGVVEHWMARTNDAEARTREALAILEQRCGACRDRATAPEESGAPKTSDALEHATALARTAGLCQGQAERAADIVAHIDDRIDELAEASDDAGATTRIAELRMLRTAIKSGAMAGLAARLAWAASRQPDSRPGRARLDADRAACAATPCPCACHQRKTA